MVREGLVRWAPQFHGYHIFVQTGNMTTAHHINKGYAKGFKASRLVQDIAQIAHEHSITISAHHLSGHKNEIPDSISRLHCPGQLLRLSALLSTLYGTEGHPTYCLPMHMSYLSWIFLLPQVTRLTQSLSLTQKWHNSAHMPLQNQQKSATNLI